jgi:hypothetical protein
MDRGREGHGQQSTLVVWFPYKVFVIPRRKNLMSVPKPVLRIWKTLYTSSLNLSSLPCLKPAFYLLQNAAPSLISPAPWLKSEVGSAGRITIPILEKAASGRADGGGGLGQGVRG